MPPITTTIAAPAARQSSTVHARRYVVADPRVRNPGVALATLLRGPAAPAACGNRPAVTPRMLREQIQKQERETTAAAQDRRDVALFLAIAAAATAITFGAPILALTQ